MTELRDIANVCESIQIILSDAKCQGIHRYIYDVQRKTLFLCNEPMETDELAQKCWFLLQKGFAVTLNIDDITHATLDHTCFSTDHLILQPLDQAFRIRVQLIDMYDMREHIIAATTNELYEFFISNDRKPVILLNYWLVREYARSVGVPGDVMRMIAAYCSGSKYGITTYVRRISSPIYEMPPAHKKQKREETF